MIQKVSTPQPSEGQSAFPERMVGAKPRNTRKPEGIRDPRAPNQKSNYELFNCSNFNIRYWSWNYRGCWPMWTRDFRFQHGLGYTLDQAVEMKGGNPSPPDPLTSSL